MLTDMSKRMSQKEWIANAWMDSVTFKSVSPNSLESSVRRLNVVDVQRVAARLFKDAPVATVVVGNSQQLKATLGAGVELRESFDVNSAADPSAPAKKP